MPTAATVSEEKGPDASDTLALDQAAFYAG